MSTSLLLVVLLISQLNQFIQIQAQCADEGTTNFTVIIEYNWNKENDAGFPNQDPSITPGFKPMFCVTHNNNFSLWKPGEKASPEFRYFFTNATYFLEEPETNPYKALRGLYVNFTTYNQASANQNSTVEGEDDEEVDYADHLLDSIQDYRLRDLDFETTIDSEEDVNITILASKSKPNISCFSMIYPSADWFVGLYNVDLCSIKENKTIDIGPLFAFDVGIYDTFDYVTGDDADIEPTPFPFIRQVRVVAQHGFGSIRLIKTIPKAETPETPEPSSGTEDGERACFPADQQISLSTGKNIRMDQLTINDNVLSSINSSNSNSNRIIAFSHYDSRVISSFINITYNFKDNSTNNIRLSPGHYIYRFLNTKKSMHLVKASKIKVGDILVSHNHNIDHPIVTNIAYVKGKGLYNPHSLNGDLIIGGIRASCYTDAMNPLTSTALLSPIRSLFQLGFGRFANLLTQFTSSAGRSLMKP